MTDPFRPFGPSSTFPRDRLTRAGIEGQALDDLAGSFDALSPAERREFTAWIDSRSDDAVRQRFGQRLTREQLDEQFTVPELEAQLRGRNLSTSGRKADLVDRLYEAMGGQPAAPADPIEATVAEGGSTATPPADAPDGVTETPDAAGDGTTDDEGDPTT